jgi:hypothetical protein
MQRVCYLLLFLEIIPLIAIFISLIVRSNCSVLTGCYNPNDISDDFPLAPPLMSTMALIIVAITAIPLYNEKFKKIISAFFVIYMLIVFISMCIFSISGDVDFSFGNWISGLFLFSPILLICLIISLIIYGGIAIAQKIIQKRKANCLW